MSRSPVSQSYTDIIPPTVWNSVQGFVASGDAKPLQRGHWRRYRIDLKTCNSNPNDPFCWGGYILHVEKIYDLAATTSLTDITKAAATHGVIPQQFMSRGRGKPVHLTKIFATQQTDGTSVVFVGRVADDAPHAPGNWALFCRLPNTHETIQYYQAHLGGLRPADLLSIGAVICRTHP